MRLRDGGWINAQELALAPRRGKAEGNGNSIRDHAHAWRIDAPYPPGADSALTPVPDSPASTLG